MKCFFALKQIEKKNILRDNNISAVCPSKLIRLLNNNERL